jgi:hypothetical protein
MACGQVCQCTDSLQLRVLCLGFLQDGDVGIGVLPEGEEVLVGFVAGERVSAAPLACFRDRDRRLFRCGEIATLPAEG